MAPPLRKKEKNMQGKKVFAGWCHPKSKMYLEGGRWKKYGRGVVKFSTLSPLMLLHMNGKDPMIISEIFSYLLPKISTSNMTLIQKQAIHLDFVRQFDDY